MRIERDKSSRDSFCLLTKYLKCSCRRFSGLLVTHEPRRASGRIEPNNNSNFIFFLTTTCSATLHSSDVSLVRFLSSLAGYPIIFNQTKFNVHANRGKFFLRIIKFFLEYVILETVFSHIWDFLDD